MDIKNTLISGEKSRHYRKQLAMSSEKRGNKDDSSVLTYKYKLDLENLNKKLGERVPSFDNYTQLYNQIEGIGIGTLTYFLCSVVLSGFRLFSNADQALNFIKEQSIEVHDNLISNKELKSTAIAYDIKSGFTPCEHGYELYLAIAKILSRYNIKEDKNINSFVKNNLTTFNNNALSWLFGSGLKFLTRATVEEIATSYGIPDTHIESARTIKAAADALTTNNISIFSNVMRLSNFRSCFGGHIDSWKTNYIKRLTELETIISALPTDMKIPEAFIKEGNDFIKHCGIKRSDLEDILNNVKDPHNVALIKDSLDRLLGKQPNATSNDIKAVRDYSALVNTLASIKDQIDNCMTQALEDSGSSWKTIKKDSAGEWKAWNRLKKLPKLNDLSGGVPEVQKKLQEKLQLLSLVTNAQKEHFKRIKNFIETHIKDFNAFDISVQTQQQRLNERPKEGTSAHELATRLFLNKIGKIARDDNNKICLEIRQWFTDNSIFESKTNFNKFFCNKLGSIYVSPYSRSKQLGYKLSKETIDNARAIIDSFNKKLSEINERYDLATPSNKYELNTLLLLNSFYYSYYISAISCTVPQHIAAPDLPAEIFDGAVSSILKMRLKEENVDASSLSSIFNVYKSLISGCYTVLNRETFFLRTKFSWIKNNKLFYVPKFDRQWQLPERYLQNIRWKKYIEEGVLSFLNNEYYVDIKKTFENICENPVEYAELLIQLPHDWYYELPLNEIKTDLKIQAIAVQKGKKTEPPFKSSKINSNISYRLIGSSSFKSRLDRILISNDEITISDMTLLVEQRVNQNFDQNGLLVLTPQNTEITLAIPVKDEQKEPPLPRFTRIVAIDQGEAGLAYAVFNIDDIGNKNAEPVASGAIRIPSIKRLIKSVNTFRKKKSTTQKFNQRFDSTMFNMRENVTGDVCGTIVGLMQKYNAFPVLEREVRNLESGSKQLSLVYKAVNSMFLYSDVDMQNTARETWWFKAPRWKTNILRKIHEEGKTKDTVTIDGQNYRELNIFPGASVSAYMTSRQCSCCGRNVYELLKQEEKDDSNKKFHIDDRGEITVCNEKIQLFKKPDSSNTYVPWLKKKKSYNAINERAPLSEPYPEGDVSIDTLRKILKFNLRRAPKSKMSKDTTQSRYFCVFSDCPMHNKEQHADVNAAINIGRRFLADTKLK